MSIEIEKTAVEECRKALESCPHDQGTVSVMCRVCVGQGEIFAWDIFKTEFLLVDCPRCNGTGKNVPELCPCLERFSKETVAQVVAVHSDEGEVSSESVEVETEGERDEVQDPLSEALKWMQADDLPETALPGAGAAEHMQNLRMWAENHREIRIPHPKASLILHLLDHDMIEFVTIPESGNLQFRAKGAKEEACRFISDLNRTYSHDQSTVLEMLNFAYGISKWEFDPVHLRRYARGDDLTEVNTEEHNLIGGGCRLRGDPEEIEAVIRSAWGCGDDE